MANDFIRKAQATDLAARYHIAACDTIDGSRVQLNPIPNPILNPNPDPNPNPNPNPNLNLNPNLNPGPNPNQARATRTVSSYSRAATLIRPLSWSTRRWLELGLGQGLTLTLTLILTLTLTLTLTRTHAGDHGVV